MHPVGTDVEQTFREVHGQAVASLVRMFGDLSVAEDAVQDAFVIASDRWSTGGIPDNPAGWIVTTAKNRAIDALRRSARGRELESEATARQPDQTEYEQAAGAAVPDDQLRLIFMCCHPALRIEHRIALTLRLLGGLTVAEIARSFLVSAETMKKRLTRAKHKIEAAGIPFRVPDDPDLPRRLEAVLSVLYLIYNAGRDAPDRSTLRADAVRLARSLNGLMPEEPEVAGLLALMLLSESRHDARLDGEEPVLLREQDRSRWDRSLIDEGHRIVRACVGVGRPGPYQLQAAIQAVHCDAATFDATDWRQIVQLYDHLLEIAPTAVVRLNRAIALAEVEGPASALNALLPLTDQLASYHLFHAAHGDLLLRLGRPEEAKRALQRAFDLARTQHDRNALTPLLDRCGLL
jgi:RNA polymerase sigma-70 factor (ECF subfamily)